MEFGHVLLGGLIGVSLVVAVEVICFYLLIVYKRKKK